MQQKHLNYHLHSLMHATHAYAYLFSVYHKPSRRGSIVFLTHKKLYVYLHIYALYREGEKQKLISCFNLQYNWAKTQIYYYFDFTFTIYLYTKTDPLSLMMKYYIFSWGEKI